MMYLTIINERNQNLEHIKQRTNESTKKAEDSGNAKFNIYDIIYKTKIAGS